MSLPGSKSDGMRVEAVALAADLDDRVVLPGDDVGVGHDECRPATQPDPSMPSPHAVPSTRTTLPAAERTCGSRAIRDVGG